MNLMTQHAIYFVFLFLMLSFHCILCGFVSVQTIFLLQINRPVDNKKIVLLRPEASRLLSLRIPKPLCYLHTGKELDNFLKCPWAQCFTKNYLFLFVKCGKTHESEQVLLLHLAGKNMFWRQKCTVFPSLGNIRRGCCSTKEYRPKNVAS